MRTEGIDAVVLADGPSWLATRTERALARLGVRAKLASTNELRVHLADASSPLWIVRAGAWPRGVPRAPTASATGRPLVAFGATEGAAGWRDVLARTGGDLGRIGGAPLPRTDSVLIATPRLVTIGASLESSLDAIVASGTVRAVRLASLDVARDERPRIVEAVTTLHRGGAERVALDLVRELRALSYDVTLAVLDRASRTTFPSPDGTVHIHELAKDRRARVAALADLAVANGADLVHAHLLDGDELRLLARANVPVVATVHNARQGWPAHLALISHDDVALLVACSRAVESELEASGVGRNVRTIWNGIRPAEAPCSRADARRSLGVPGDALVLLAVANHRAQKRLERLPAILAAIRRGGRDARLVLVGEPVRSSPEALEVAEAIRREAALHAVADAIVHAGSHPDVRPLYAAADVVVSTSAFEGLSLVHLEALAAGVPLVTTAVSGTDELARKHPRMRVIAHDLPPEAFAHVVLEITAETAPSSLAPDFTAKKMAERHAELFARVVALRAPRTRTADVVLVTNNFSTGGAQSSARRLLLALAESGIRVSAVVLEEQAEYPTPGRAALERAGITVFAAPRAGSVDPLVTARAVAKVIDGAGPEAVLFWNVIPEHKILLADMLLGVPVWDVSPGEMYFTSFDRYFRTPRIGSPYLDTRDYGRRLAGAIVKYEAERERAANALETYVSVIANGVHVPAAAAARPPARDHVVIGTLARLSPDKKLEQLVSAIAHASPRLAGCEVRIAGGVERGSERYAEELRASSRGLPIVWCGEQDSASLLAACDFFAMVSEPSGCPNASIEAMAGGLAVVATDAGGVREQVVHGKTGLLVPRGDVSALGDAIAELAADPARRTSMGHAGHARARDLYDVHRMARDYARICLGRDLEGRAAAE